MGRGSTFKAMLARGALALAMVSLCLRVLTPAGFMPAFAQGTGALPALVICTGHGAVEQAPSHKAPADSPRKQDNGHACVFAGAAPAAADVLTAAFVAPAYARTDAPAATAGADQRPGLGLAAPPPPAQAPPTLPI